MKKQSDLLDAGSQNAEELAQGAPFSSPRPARPARAFRPSRSPPIDASSPAPLRRGHSQRQQPDGSPPARPLEAAGAPSPKPRTTGEMMSKLRRQPQPLGPMQTENPSETQTEQGQPEKNISNQDETSQQRISRVKALRERFESGQKDWFQSQLAQFRTTGNRF
eukprot:GHVT01049859.1.p2 GENE.GHVT01049859.1~~GHVT01049859.1.p2  ORF type:complete len:184 (+),score=42.01 GHVT01049859.1:61-552(+)